MEQKTILIVDDSPDNLDALKIILKPLYNLRMVTSGRLALKISMTDSQRIDLILLDVMMPDLDGYEVCRLLKADERTRHIPIIFVTARSDAADETRGFELGAEDYIVKPVSAPITLARVATHIALNDRSRLLEQRVRERTALLEKRTRELEETRMQILHRLTRASEYRDNETGMHLLRISEYVGLLGTRIGLSALEVDELKHAALMHDIGKIGIPDQVLLKPGRLEPEEFEIVKRHCQIGADIIGHHESSLLQMCRSVALTHHERWDGSGYPNGLSGTDIPLAGRITAVADVFDALVSHRPYKTAWPPEEALAHIASLAGSGLDPLLAEAFVSMKPELTDIMSRYADHDKNALPEAPVEANPNQPPRLPAR